MTRFANVHVIVRGQRVCAEGALFTDNSVGIFNELDECVLTDESGNELPWDLSDDEVRIIVDAACKQLIYGFRENQH